MESNNKPDDRDFGKSDVWSEWLLHRRHADDTAYGRLVQAAVEGYADRVLDGARTRRWMSWRAELCWLTLATGERP